MNTNVEELINAIDPYTILCPRCYKWIKKKNIHKNKFGGKLIICTKCLKEMQKEDNYGL